MRIHFSWKVFYVLLIWRRGFEENENPVSSFASSLWRHPPLDYGFGDHKIFFLIFNDISVVSVFIQWITGQSFDQREGNFFVGLPTWPWTQNETSFSMENDYLFKPLVQAIPVTILAGTVREFCHPIAFPLNSIFLTGEHDKVSILHFIGSPFHCLLLYSSNILFCSTELWSNNLFV